MLSRRSLLAQGLATVAAVALAAAAPALFASAQAETGVAPDQARSFIDQTAQQLVNIVNGPGDVATRQGEMGRVISQAVDMEGAARFSLGRFWRTASEDQRRQYTELFTRAMVASLTSRMGEYKGVTYSVGQARRRDDGVVVPSIVNRPNNQPAHVDWLVAAPGGTPKIIDVIAEGTSMRLTQRSDYSAYLGSHGNNVQALLDAMRNQLSRPQG